MSVCSVQIPLTITHLHTAHLYAKAAHFRSVTPITVQQVDRDIVQYFSPAGVVVFEVCASGVFQRASRRAVRALRQSRVFFADSRGQLAEKQAAKAQAVERVSECHNMFLPGEAHKADDQGTAPLRRGCRLRPYCHVKSDTRLMSETDVSGPLLSEADHRAPLASEGGDHPPRGSPFIHAL